MIYIFRAAIVICLCSGLLSAANFNDIRILKKDVQETVYEYSVQNFVLSDAGTENGITHSIARFENAIVPENNQEYPLPARSLQFIIPEHGDISVQILSKSEKQINNIQLKKSDGLISVESVNQGNNLIEIGPKIRFRDMMTRSIQINPIKYDATSGTITLIKKITFKVTYNGDAKTTTNYRRQGKLDDVYKDIFINFEQAKNWQIKKAKTLYKRSSLSSGISYGFDVTEDGIYKITATTLKNLGIDTDALSINSVQMYNNGGHMLSFATTAEQYNPPFTQEVAIIIIDQNNNNLFDGSDYLLFYGKSVNSWFYDATQNEFINQTHSYDTKNKYYLSVNGSSGKRMQLNQLQAITPQITQNYYMNKYHYENDLYNLLDSGPDWYGYKFYGTSDSHAFDFDLNFMANTGAIPSIEIQMKGGSGIHYLENGYRYNFDMTLNGLSLNFLPFSNSARKERTFGLNDTYLRNGQNRLNIQYQSSNEGSSVYLDYFSVLYPSPLQAENELMQFYTTTNTQNVSYSVSGFNGQSVYLLDVTDPVTPEILLQNQSVSGNLDLTFPAGMNEKELIAFTLTSQQIKSINNLKSYTPTNNLLDVNKAADFIVITRQSLREYASQIADLRNHLRTEVATIEDIYFYFNSGVADPTAIRNFIRYAYYNWQTPSLSYVLLLGDGHYDYRNIIISDSMVVPPFEIYSDQEYPGARETDLFFGQIDNSNNGEYQSKITPSVAIGRLPVENVLDAERVVEKLKNYELNPVKDGWQTNITFVADDEKGGDRIEWLHQDDADQVSQKTELNRFNINKIYLSAYESQPGGRGVIKPGATNALIDQINRGTLMLNYTGHGSPTQWAHETVFQFERDYNKINNENRLPFIIAATCDFGLFDDPSQVSFSEALIWKEKSGAIGILAATRLVEANANDTFVKLFYSALFKSSGPSVPLGQAFISAINTNAGSSNVNDQKYHLFADPSMRLADGHDEIEIVTDFPDTLKALSEVTIKGNVKVNNQIATSFTGGAVMIINDAKYENVTTGGGLYYTLKGPLIFRGEVSVENGELEGNFIVPKSIRYNEKRTGRITFYAWDENSNTTAMGYNNNLLFLGSSSRTQENEGPEMDIYFEDQENFRSGDMITANPILIAKLNDESGINVTGQLGHKIELRIDNDEVIDVSEAFTYNRDRFTEGFIHYALTSLTAGDHTLTLLAYDNLNNRTEETVNFSITESTGLELQDVINYPNPFRKNTDFTFQTNADAADVTVKIYTIAGRLIETLEGYTTVAGYNEIAWNGTDRDGNTLANGVYLYKLILKLDGETKEKIEKMVVLK